MHGIYYYYSHKNNLHHKNEEEILFPLLVDQSNLRIGMIERLMLGHKEIEKLWGLLTEKLRKPELVTHLGQFTQLTA